MQEEIKKILETPYWIPTLKSNHPYFINNDDCDGQLKEGIQVTIDNQGDAWITVNDKRGYCTARMRTFAGGGHNSRTRNALMILAEAIRLDNENPIA